MEATEGRREYLAQVACEYYDQNKTQQEIADRIGVTRSAISRLLTEARAKGIVEIVVHYPWRTSPELEAALVGQFGLKAARVLVRENKTYEETLKGLGVLTAQYFDAVVQEDSVIGITWGTNLYQVVQAIRPRSLAEAEVIQLIGGTGAERGSAIGPLLAPMLANSLGCTCRYLHAPLIAESEASRDALMQERSIRETLERGRQADIALVGIGSTRPELYNPYRMGYVSEAELDQIRAAGAIGDVCVQPYGLDGHILDVGVSRRVVGITSEWLAQIETVIGVAGDVRKAEAIYGALMGKYVNVLVTDDQTVLKVLAYHNTAPK
jgi:DNA-binding transcriptional regulator LsrR (DeoR family)